MRSEEGVDLSLLAVLAYGKCKGNAVQVVKLKKVSCNEVETVRGFMCLSD